MTTGKSSQAKGKELEHYIADQIREKGLDPNATRSAGSGATNREKADIDTSLTLLGRNIGIEAKNYKNAHVQDWWKQAQKLEKLGREPVVVYSLGGEGLGETKAIIYLDTLLELIKKAQEEKTVERILETQDKYKLDRLKASLTDVIKLFKE